MAADIKHKTLIVGGAGYIGLTLAERLLAKGWPVTIFDSLLFGAEELNSLNYEHLTFIKGDLRDISAVNRVVAGHDNVILLAALVGEPACNIDPEVTLEVNYLGSLNLLEAARYHGVSRFVFASTDSCYGTREGELLDEESPLCPISLYAELKAKMETQILSRPSISNFSPTILRLATVYGLARRIRFDLAVNLLVREAALKGRAKIFGGEQWRPLVHVADVAKAFDLTLSVSVEKVRGQIFNVGSNEQNIQFKDLGLKIALACPDAVIETVPQPPDLRDYHVNFDKVKRVLGFVPDYDLSRGIKEIKNALSEKRFDPYHPRFRNVA